MSENHGNDLSRMLHSFPSEMTEHMGPSEAVLLDLLAYKTGTSRNEHDGRCWFYETAEQLHDRFPYLSASTITTIGNRLAGMKDPVGKLWLSIETKYNRRGRDRTRWYSASDQAVSIAMGRKGRVCFLVAHAVRYGIPAAVLIYNLNYWVGQNREKGTEDPDWHPMSPALLAKSLPFFSLSTIKRVLADLVREKIVETAPRAGSAATRYRIADATVRRDFEELIALQARVRGDPAPDSDPKDGEAPPTEDPAPRSGSDLEMGGPKPEMGRGSNPELSGSDLEPAGSKTEVSGSKLASFTQQKAISNPAKEPAKRGGGVSEIEEETEPEERVAKGSTPASDESPDVVPLSPVLSREELEARNPEFVRLMASNRRFLVEQVLRAPPDLLRDIGILEAARKAMLAEIPRDVALSERNTERLMENISATDACWGRVDSKPLDEGISGLRELVCGFIGGLPEANLLKVAGSISLDECLSRVREPLSGFFRKEAAAGAPSVVEWINVGLEIGCFGILGVDYGGMSGDPGPLLSGQPQPVNNAIFRAAFDVFRLRFFPRYSDIRDRRTKEQFERGKTEYRSPTYDKEIEGSLSLAEKARVFLNGVESLNKIGVLDEEMLPKEHTRQVVSVPSRAEKRAESFFRNFPDLTPRQALDVLYGCMRITVTEGVFMPTEGSFDPKWHARRAGENLEVFFAYFDKIVGGRTRGADKKGPAVGAPGK